MTVAQARTMVLKQVRREGCTCPEPQIVIDRLNDERVVAVAVGHDDSCPREPCSVAMRALSMMIAAEVKP